MDINCPGRNHTLKLPVAQSQHYGSPRAGSSVLPWEHFGGIPLSAVHRSIKFPDVYNITFFVHLHMWPRSGSVFLETTRTQAGAFHSFFLCVVGQSVDYWKMMTLSQKAEVTSLEGEHSAIQEKATETTGCIYCAVCWSRTGKYLSEYRVV